MADEKDYFKKRFFHTSPELIHILESMLQFNPVLRPTAKELLKNPIFDKMRVSENELSSPHKIVIDIDQNHFKQQYDDEKTYTDKEKKDFI